MHADATIRERVTRARLAVSTIFFVNGLALASWVPQVPAVEARFALSDMGVIAFGARAVDGSWDRRDKRPP